MLTTSSRSGEAGAGGKVHKPRDPAPSIEVALATYQSARFLREQLDSLFAQTLQNFTLLVADDGSRDATTAILDEYSARYPGRIRIVARNQQPGGAPGNFARLIDHASADYLFLCDHDDVWSATKIARSLARMSTLVATRGDEIPLLVHTDLAVVDENLEPLDTSLFRYQSLDPTRNDVTSLLMANVASGCTMMMNRALYERARPIPPEAVMHDHWLALVAATLGTISCLPEPTILYRQHGANVVGAKRGGSRPLSERVRHALISVDRQRMMSRYSHQAETLMRRYGSEMSGDARRAAETLARIWSVSPWRRFALLRRNGLGLPGFTRNVALFIVLSRAYSTANQPSAS